MEDRLLLDKMIDVDRGTVSIAGTEHALNTRDFPTLDPEHPYRLTDEEQRIVDKLIYEFTSDDRLCRHIEFLYSHGSIYLARNGNLLFHGCVPMNEDGTFSSMNCMGTWRAGRDYLDFCDHIARKAWRDRSQEALDWMWYLWIGFKSPISGRVVKTFERSYIDDRSTWEEPMDPYFELTHDIYACDAIMREFGLMPGYGHIINGHTPVKTKKGEQPIRADGRLLVIDGGFCQAYHPKTGIAGYTLISSSRGMRLKAHEAFKSVEESAHPQRRHPKRDQPLRCRHAKTHGLRHRYGRGHPRPDQRFAPAARRLPQRHDRRAARSLTLAAGAGQTRRNAPDCGRILMTWRDLMRHLTFSLHMG